MRGCPDSDRDGTADKDDACPDAPGEASMQGCPDRDGDKVPDFRDECPDEPIPEDAVAETSNGCPSRVYVVDGAIRITERVNFDTGRATIRPDSYGLLDDVASIIKSNPQARKIQVGGHTDDRGDSANNQRLSQSRAEAVVAYLVGKGVNGSRLDARGFGQERPIDTNRTTAGRATNRRVEFTITETAPIEAPAPAAPAPRVQPTTPTATPDAPAPAGTAPMQRPSPGDSPWTMPADDATLDEAEEVIEDVIEDVVEEAPPAPVMEDVIVPEGLDDAVDGAGPSDDLEETLRRGGNPWGPR
jgi:outer membrane protein OmpA-like peptidoglycan-associated protein